MSNDSRMCNCIGPQNGEPRCPCMMGSVERRDGRWIERARDLGPVSPLPDLSDFGHHKWTAGHGCICPAGSEKTCQGIMCPRRAPQPAQAM